MTSKRASILADESGASLLELALVAPLFAGLLAGVILILGGLQFLPSLALGPLAEHFVLLAGKTF